MLGVNYCCVSIIVQVSIFFLLLEIRFFVLLAIFIDKIKIRINTSWNIRMRGSDVCGGHM